MSLYTNLNLSVLTAENLSESIIRSCNNNYIVGIVFNSSSLLHKQKRFRDGGLFCEEIFGFLYLCNTKECYYKPQFNDNPILNKICINCYEFMNFNFKRKYRFAAVLLNTPVINYFYFNRFIKLCNIFKTFSKYYYTTKRLLPSTTNICNANNFVHSLVLENKFVNFIRFFNKITNYLYLFQKYLKILIKKTKTITDKFSTVTKLMTDGKLLKQLFLTLFPILPCGLRLYALDNKKVPVNSRLNGLYSGMIDLNNMLVAKLEPVPYMKVILALHIVIESILNFYKPKDGFNQTNDLYNKLYGKYGVFRQNLLGFRVDYSGRASIVPGPGIPVHNVGVPCNMLVNRVRKPKEYVNTDEFYESPLYKHYMLDKLDFFETKLIDYTILLNRAPTLHKMNIQSFCPVLVEGESIQFNPLLCSGYNADFDGDQMGVFAVLKRSALSESMYMLRYLVNLHSPTTKTNVFNLTQSMLAGCYMLSNYNYLKGLNSYISNNYIDTIEYMDKTIFIDAPVIVRSCNFFYRSTTGRLLLHF